MVRVSKKIKSIIIYHWVQFCLNTSLHGWKYTALPKSSKWERNTWLIMCFTALGVSLYLLTSAWLKFQTNPTITVTESTQHSIYKFMFPAVTICSLNKISKSAAYEMANKLTGRNAADIDSVANSLKLLFHLVNNDNHSVPKQDYENLHYMLNSSGQTEEKVFKSISPSCSTLLKKCMWKGEDKRCAILFEKIKTPLGFCCSFNYFALKNGSLTRSSAFSHSLPKHPRRTSSCGFPSGLELLIDNDPENYFATHIPSIGYRVLIHHPYQYPDWTVPSILCETNTNNFIGINPEIISATKNIRSRRITERGCLFPYERSLDTFDMYSFDNCMVECKMSWILELCGCIPFYVHNKADIMYNISFIKMKMDKDGKCNCLPTCESAAYFPEVSRGILDSSYCTSQFSIYSGMNLENHTIIRVFFNDLLGIRHRRDVLFTWNSLMGYYGGILGLFTGFSFISVLEIIYFAVISFVNNGSSKKKKNCRKIKCLGHLTQESL